jgi:hypothetical protein
MDTPQFERTPAAARIRDDRNSALQGELIWVGSLNAAIFHGEWLVS